MLMDQIQHFIINRKMPYECNKMALVIEQSNALTRCRYFVYLESKGQHSSRNLEKESGYIYKLLFYDSSCLTCQPIRVTIFLYEIWWPPMTNKHPWHQLNGLVIYKYQMNWKDKLRLSLAPVFKNNNQRWFNNWCIDYKDKPTFKKDAQSVLVHMELGEFNFFIK